MKELEILITPKGKAISVYKDELKPFFKEMGTVDIKRASNVEWEHIYSNGQTYEGWTVRSYHSPEYCFLRRSPMDGGIEVTTNGHGLPAFFATREEALAEEVKHFWELLPEEAKR
jgi:hypothetical protein